MTAAELGTALAGLPDDLPVMVQSDSEGNNHSPAGDVELALDTGNIESPRGWMPIASAAGSRGRRVSA